MNINKFYFIPRSVVLALILIASAFIFHPWTDQYTNGLISWDKLGYYLYLPTFFIYKDWHYFSFINSYFPAYQPSLTWYSTLITPEWKHVITYPIGVSFFQLPFFLLGHFFAKIFNYVQDGFSKPYVFWIYLSGVFYVLLGLYYSFKNLCYYFSEKISWLIVLLLLLSTNLYYYGFVDNIMPHSYSFFLFAFMLNYTIKWHERATFKRGLIVCLSIGFMISIRTTDCVAAFIPLLYGINNFADFRNKILLFKNNARNLFLAFLIGTVPFIIQMYYWHFATGYWLFNAYSYTYLSFNWLHPHIIDFLFSFRKGWFIYTPSILVSIVGLFFMRNSKLKKLLPGLVIFLFANLYILSSWNSWWFGGSFGQRTMVQANAFLIIPFAVGLFSLFKIKWLRLVAGFFISACLVINLLFTWVYKNSLMLTDGMNQTMFMETLLHPLSAYIPVSKRVNTMQWKDEWIDYKNLEFTDTATKILHHGDFSEIKVLEGGDVIQLPYKWIRCTFETKFQPPQNIFPNNLHLVLEIKDSKNKTRFWKGKSFTDQFGTLGKMSDWVTRTIDFRIPNNIQNEDKCLLYFWLPEDEIVHVKSVVVHNFNVKE